MTMKALKDSISLHDSLITNITFNDESRTLDITIEFCLWLQSGYIDGEPEVCKAHLLFSGLTDVDTDGLNGEVDFYSIIESIVENDRMTLIVLDDFNDKKYTLRFTAADVCFVQESAS